MTWHKLSSECAPTLERDQSAEEFFESFPEEYQHSRDLIRQLFETLKRLHDESHDDEIDAPPEPRSAEDGSRLHRWIHGASSR